MGNRLAGWMVHQYAHQQIQPLVTDLSRHRPQVCGGTDQRKLHSNKNGNRPSPAEKFTGKTLYLRRGPNTMPPGEDYHKKKGENGTRFRQHPAYTEHPSGWPPR